MILVTGGTGFVGRAVVRQLVEAGYDVRMLIRPSPTSPDLPRGVAVEVAVSSLNDLRGLRAAMRDVDTIFHLAGAEHRGAQANLLEVDVKGTETIVRAAQDARIKRFYSISHLGADRASAYPVMKAKGIAEEYIRRSGIPFTIFRSALLYGPEDHFTTGLARLVNFWPVIFLPGSGEILIQPLWVEDLVTCMLWSLDSRETIDQTYEVGGSEYFTFKQVMEMILQVRRKRRLLVPLSMPYLRWLTVLLESSSAAFPTSVFWLDYLAFNRTCPVDTIPRVFGLIPARLGNRLDYLEKKQAASIPFRSRFQRR